MSYDKPNRIKYAFLYDFGSAANEAFVIRGPKGKAGRLWDYGVEGTTEAFSGSTITPKISVGTSSDADAYGEEIDLQGLAIDDAISVRTQYTEADAGFDTLMVDRTLPKDTKVYLTCTGATNSPTGIGTAFVIIDWAD